MAVSSEAAECAPAAPARKDHISFCAGLCFGSSCARPTLQPFHRWSRRRLVRQALGTMDTISDRIDAFCRRFGLRMPILLAPMAGASPPSLSIAVANAGGLGACGALLMTPAAIMSWVTEVRAATDGPLQLNLWVRSEEHTSELQSPV